MKNINIKLITFATVTGLFLSACGGGGGGSSSGGSTPPPAVVKVPQCGTAVDLGKSNAIDVTGKTIKKVANGAEVRIWHKPDGTKVACMITGEATVDN